MPQVDFGSLYKFVASIGLALIVAAFAMPWVISQSFQVFLVSQETLDGLPDGAAQAVQRRQDVAVWVQDELMFPLAVAMGFVGLFMLFWALVKWAPSQEVTDQAELLAMRTSEVQFRELTKDEVDSKLEDEATEGAAQSEQAPPPRATPPRGGDSRTESDSPPDADADDAKRGRDDTASADAPTAESDEATDSSARARAAARLTTEELVARVRATEDEVSALVKAAYGVAFEVTRDVKITSGFARNRSIDVLLDPRGGEWAQLGVEIRRLFGAPVMPNRLQEMMSATAIATQDLAHGKVFTGARGRPRDAKASGVLMLVLPTSSFTANAFRIQRNVPVLNSVLKRPVGVVVISELRLAGATALEVRDAISQVWAEPAQAWLLGPPPRRNEVDTREAATQET